MIEDKKPRLEVLETEEGEEEEDGDEPDVGFDPQERKQHLARLEAAKGELEAQKVSAFTRGGKPVLTRRNI